MIKWKLVYANELVHALVGSGEEKRSLALAIFGSNLSLDGQKLVSRATKPWDTLASSNPRPDFEHVVAAVRTAFEVAGPVDGGHDVHGITPKVIPGS